MAEEGERPRSKLYALEPIVRKLPEVSVPKRHVSFKEKFVWIGIALVGFLVMCRVPLYGMTKEVTPWFGQLQFILASSVGTLMELGIGPIVTAGIIMQLLVGGKIIGLNMTKPEDRVLFTSVQKFLAIIVCIFQASMLVLSGRYGVGGGRMAFLIIQLVIGGIIVIYLDEVVSKYGFGSGISLFIVAGVASTVFWQAFNPFGTPMYGAIPNFIQTLMGGGGIYDSFFRAWPLPNMMGVIATILVFFIVAYVESVRIEIPLAYGRFGGIRGRYPIKFMYTSVIPVILAMVVFANIQILANFFTPISGIIPYIRAPNGPMAVANAPLQAVIYLVILIPLCMGFAWLWVNMTGMGPRDVAEQLDRGGMLIPGFRRDVRVMERVLSRYIMMATLLGGATVAALSAGADFLGALGSGTGILLTVSIMYSLYEEIAKERIGEMFPAARRFFGE